MRQPSFKRVWMLLAALATSGSVSAGEPITIEVFTSRPHGVMTLEQAPGVATVDVYALDGLERFEARLSRSLPMDPATAKAMVVKRLGTLTETDLKPVRRAAQGLGLAVQYGVDRIPAAVVNQEAIVYGETDAAEILEYYEAWRTTAP